MKKLASLLAVFVLLFALAAPAHAIDFGIVYEGTGLLDSVEFESLTDAIAQKCDEVQYDMHVDIITETQGYTLDEYAEAFYETYEYGYNGTTDGSVLMLQLHFVEGENDLVYDGYSVYIGGRGKSVEDTIRASLDQVLPEYLNEAAWEGGLDSDRDVCMRAMAAYVGVVSTAVSAVETGKNPEDTHASSVAGLANVTDLASLLTEEQRAELSARAKSISDTYGCAVYLLTVEDYTDYEGSQYGIYSFATNAFTQYNLGLGEDKNGVMLVLSMAERDYTLIAHGDIGNSAFTDHGKDVLADDGFLPYFARNDWYGGFTAYLDGCESFLAQNAQGTPFDIDTDPEYGRVPTGTKIAIIVIIPAIIAFIACTIMKGKMKSVALKTNANDYISRQGVALTDSSDIYTHTTQTRVRIEEPSRSSGHGGTSIGSGGFSGKSGKF